MYFSGEYNDYKLIFNGDSGVIIKINDSNRQIDQIGDDYHLYFNDSEIERESVEK
jgi:hypothetical protein